MHQLDKRTFAQRHAVSFMCFFATVLIILGFYDQVLSQLFSRLSNESFVKFQSQSVFSDGTFGGSDLGTFFQLACFFYVIFFMCKKSLRSPFQIYLARYCSFVVLASIYYALVLVQGTKFAVGRTRPYLVLGTSGIPELYSEWYEFGLHSIASGKYPGSFPSGHTASAAAFFALLFFSWFGRWSAFKRRSFTFAVLALSFSQWLLMGIARVMGKDHWPTDCAAAGLFVFASFAFFANKMRLNTAGETQGVYQGLSSTEAAASGRSMLFPDGFVRSYCYTLGISLFIVLLFWAARETILP